MLRSKAGGARRWSLMRCLLKTEGPDQYGKMGGCTVAPDSPSLYQIEARIRSALREPLPGAGAHLSLAPRPRRGWRPGHVPDGAQPAAGLVLLYARNDAPRLLLTVRAAALPQHGGQVSLPGGRVEPSETIPAAALREAAEEVGVEPGRVRLLGRLSPLYVSVSNFALHPVVGVAAGQPAFRPRSAEVRRVLEVPLAALLGPRGQPRRGFIQRPEAQVRVPYFELLDERLWGATAMVLAELLAVLGAPPADPWAAAPGDDAARRLPAPAPDALGVGAGG